MDKLIRHIAEILDNQKRWVNIGGWGSISLPSGKQLNYNFNNGCYIEVAGIGSRVFPTINIYGQWITVEDFEYELRELFKGFKFTNRQINRFFNSMI